MARAHTRCTACDDKLWFHDEDEVPQAVVCRCGTTTLAESGPSGLFEALSDSEVAEIASAIQRRDLVAMRTIFDDAGVQRPRHCFRWSNQNQRWELSRVLPTNRTLMATRKELVWSTV